ncbi:MULTISPECIES: hypothetical protein [Bacteroidales]|uniref:hypothetical protein n=1 Tax=Bacteroidales TaxID=171549 RepID=UPI00241BE8E4|nr:MULTISPECIES: hypothetical protein [Bacteroidales]
MKKIYSILLSVCLAVGIFASCSEDAIDDGLSTGKGKTRSIAFSLSGLDMGMDLSTRSASTRTPGVVDFNKYSVKCFVFYRAQAGTEDYNEFKYVREEFVDASYYVVNNLQPTGDYVFAFLAAEKAYAPKDGGGTDYLKLKTGMYNPQPVDENSDFRYCYIPAFDESGESYSIIREAGATDDFMVWGVTYFAPSELTIDNTHTPQNIILKRQMGAIQFQASPTVGEITECSVFSNYYRLYLPQMLNTENASVACTTTETLWGQAVEHDFAGNHMPYKYITKTFNGDNYLYMPCTILKENNSIEAENCANTLTGCVVNAGDASFKPISVTIGNDKFQTSVPFPIFPNRKTILRVADGTNLEVIYGKDGGINLDDDEWDGIH